MRQIKFTTAYEQILSFDDKDFTEYVTADSVNISMSIPQDVIAKYEAGKSYKIVYGYYKDDEPLSISTSWIEINNPHFLYTPYYEDGQCQNDASIRIR